MYHQAISVELLQAPCNLETSEICHAISAGMFINHLYLTLCYCVNRWLYSATSLQPRDASCVFCLSSNRAMQTPPRSTRLLRAKLFPPPAQRRGVLMKRWSPLGRSVSQFDMKNLYVLAKSPRSSNSASEISPYYSCHANGYRAKRLLEQTSRTKRACSSSAVTPEPGCKHKRKSSIVSVVWGTQWQEDHYNFEPLPEQSATEGHDMAWWKSSNDCRRSASNSSYFCLCWR